MPEFSSTSEFSDSVYYKPNWQKVKDIKIATEVLDCLNNKLKQYKSDTLVIARKVCNEYKKKDRLENHFRMMHTKRWVTYSLGQNHYIKAGWYQSEIRNEIHQSLCDCIY